MRFTKVFITPSAGLDFRLDPSTPYCIPLHALITVCRNLRMHKEDKAVQFAAEVTNRFMALEAAQNEVTPEDLWKGTKRVLLEMARETIGSIKSQKKKKWISDAT